MRRAWSGGRVVAAGLVAGVLVAALGCGGGGSSRSDGDAPPPDTHTASVFVVTTDFDTGSYAIFPLGDPATIARNVGEVHSDAVARTHDGIVYVVNRLGGDNIQAIDPRRGFETLWQCSVGNGSNPHDFVWTAPNKAYVTLYERTTVAIVDPSVGSDCAGFMRGEIDLAALADADGVPEMDQATLVGSRLYVGLQRLDRRNFFAPTDGSVLAVIDTATDTLVDTVPATPSVDGIRLAGTNPFTESHGLTVDPATGEILVSTVGSFGTIGDGGIERVDTRTNLSAGFFVTETDLGSNITDFVVVDDRQAYALLIDLDSRNRLVRFDPATGTVTRTLLTSSEFIVDIELDPARRELYVTDRTLTRPGIRIFDIQDDHEVTTAPIDTGLPPFDVVFVDADTTPPPAEVVVPSGFYVGTTSDGGPISLQVASIDTVFFTCGGTVVRGDAGGTIAADGSFDVAVAGVSLRGSFDANGNVAGTISGDGCEATFDATLRAGAADQDGDGIPDLVDPDPAPAVCGNGVREDGEACDGGHAGCADGEQCSDACVCVTVPPTCGNGVVETGEQCDGEAGSCAAGMRCDSSCACVAIPATCGNDVVEAGETCDGTNAPCGTGSVCGGDCRCHVEPGACSSETVTIDLDTPAPIAAATVLLDYPEDAVAIPGGGDAPSVVARIAVLTGASLFGNGAPNDDDDRVRFTVIAIDGVGEGPLFDVRFDCLGSPAPRPTFSCTVTDAVGTDGVTPIPDAACTLRTRSE